MQRSPDGVARQPSAPHCSLVIATLHDDGELEPCLASLVKQENAPTFEVIVVDQNGDDRLVEVIARFAGLLDIRHEQVDFRSATRARNLGARLARGIWLGFPDDDCQLLSDALGEVRRLSNDPQTQVITGQTIDETGAPNVLRWKQEPTEFTRRTMFSCLTEATLFVRRELFLQVDGFVERFGPGAPLPRGRRHRPDEPAVRAHGRSESLLQPANQDAAPEQDAALECLGRGSFPQLCHR
ncbi:glycosyltransferase family 2 protein [Pseudomonas kuykendallii]|uniref:Glycosyltransferase 2-like domain-containing protein n=1 Tax=Pseudomonas kuykendallii TaxID=1007099 RepID=A0A2W5F236_9PSED|nr:glycosyltransferase family 2 protein [Pseudomonas kuykendallii]PZP25232.1 MAG: hypothetical protein DI599_05540 [Pseudomonas kuykendallii]